MSESRIPTSRLFQIAQRKLRTLGIETRLSQDKTRLDGEIALEESLFLRNSLGHSVIERIGFSVEGHDHIRLHAPPPLARMSPVGFFDFEQKAELVGAIKTRFELRVAAIQKLVKDLALIGVKAEVDGNMAMAVVQLKLDGLGRIVLHGDERGLLAIRLHPLSGPDLPLGDLPLDLKEVRQRVDLELSLSSLVENVRKAPLGQESQQSTRPTSSTVPAAAPSCPEATGVLTVGALSAAFGNDALVNSRVLISKILDVQGRQVRFRAAHAERASFSCKLDAAEGLIWSGSFELEGFPGVEDFVAKVMGTGPVSTAGRDQRDRRASVSALGTAFDYQLPAVGEVWLMDIVIEEETETDYHYSGVGVDGQPYGAPRVLPKDVFLNTFVPTPAGTFRMVVEVLDLKAGVVFYSRLDPKRQRVGKPASLHVPHFISNFTPEAAAY